MSDDLPLPSPLLEPISAKEALRLLDVMIALCGLYKKGRMGEFMPTQTIWLRQIRPFVAEAAARSNDG